MSTSRVFLTSGINKDVGAAQAELLQKYIGYKYHEKKSKLLGQKQ